MCATHSGYIAAEMATEMQMPWADAGDGGLLPCYMQLPQKASFRHHEDSSETEGDIKGFLISSELLP